MKLERMTDKEIADSLFISTATLSRWKRANGVKAERTAEDYIHLRKQGYADKHICVKWGISPSALYQWKISKNLPKELFTMGRFTKRGINYNELGRHALS
jgi:uncharacterized protein YjcR